jgi:hypothetical protein
MKSSNEDRCWRGYTLSELRYRKAINQLAIDVVKERLCDKTLLLRQAGGSRLSVRSRLLRVVAVINYAIGAIKIFKRLSRVVSALRSSR